MAACRHDHDRTAAPRRGSTSPEAVGPIVEVGAVIEDNVGIAGHFGFSSGGLSHRHRRNVYHSQGLLGSIRVANDDGATIDDLLSEREVACDTELGVYIDDSGRDAPTSTSATSR